MKKKSYCIFATQYFPTLGGAELYTYNLSKQLIENGNTVVLVTSLRYELPQYEIIEGMEIYRLPSLELLNGRYPVVKKTKDVKMILKELSKRTFDFVLINSRFYMLSLLGARFASKNHIPALVLEHGSGHLSVQNKILDVIGGMYEHFHTFVLKRYCKNYYGTCEECNQWLKHFGIQSQGIIYNAIDMKEVQEGLMLPPIYRKKYHIPQEAKVIAFTGRIIKEKGIVQLIEAVKQINRDDVYLLIAGEGTMKAALEKEADDHIIFMGRISHMEIMRMLGESDIYCLPSDSEAFCTAVLEAIACKCYVITTERGGIKELIDNKRLGTIIKNNQTESVCHALEKALSDEKMCSTATELAYLKLAEGFTWEKTAEHFQEIADELCEKRGKND